MKAYTLHTPGYRKMPLWARRAFVADDGQVFLPAAMMFGNEMKALLMLGYDGPPVVTYDGHLYAPADWMIRETKEPKIKAIIKKAAQRLRECDEEEKPAKTETA
jgi:hypothetical protein